MINSLLLIAAVVALIYTIKHIRGLAPEERKKSMIKYGLYLAAIVLIILVLLGRLHWISAGIAALLPLAQKLFYTGMRVMPFLKYWQTQKQKGDSSSDQQASSNTFSGKMSVAEAQEIMGLDTIENAAQVSKRHKQLMQKMHPDRGGSDYLAAQINQAKETLINHLKT